MGIIPDFFSKKEESTLEKLKNQIKSAKKTTTKTVRKKVVKKTVKSLPKTKTSSPIAKKALIQETILTPNVLTFYGRNLRRVYMKNRWYFNLEDIFIISGTTNLKEFVSKIKNNKEFKENSNKSVVNLKIKDNEEVKTAEFIDFEGFTSLVPIIRSLKVIFPGPFPDWLEQISKAPPIPSSFN